MCSCETCSTAVAALRSESVSTVITPTTTATLDTALMYVQPLPLRGFDEECRQFIAEQYEVAGLNIHSESTPTRIEKQNNGTFTLHVKKKAGGEEAIEGLETVLMATGRSPNSQNMNLEEVCLSSSLPSLCLQPVHTAWDIHKSVIVFGVTAICVGCIHISL